MLIYVLFVIFLYLLLEIWFGLYREEIMINFQDESFQVFKLQIIFYSNVKEKRKIRFQHNSIPRYFKGQAPPSLT